MHFRIADTFTDSLTRLTGEEQKAAKTTAFDLQLNPANPGMQFRKLNKPKDKNFWSVRVSADIRLIVHKTADSLLLCYVAHHDKAYDWAERRKLKTHPKTDAAQWVEIREMIQEVLVPRYVEELKPAAAAKPLFTHVPDNDLLGYGVPAEWLADVRNATGETLLTVADHLPAEAAEALLELATGGKPRAPQPVAAAINPFDHPDAQRRFRVMGNVEELERALEFPWDRWTVFLHPEQRQWVEREYSGPARVSGSAGTGKTIVALHRAVFLARSHPEARVLLTTFSDTLANALRTQLRRLASNEHQLPNALTLTRSRLSARASSRPISARRISRHTKLSSNCWNRHPEKLASTSSAGIFCSRNGSRLSMRGNWIAGRRIAMSRAWAGRHDSRNSSAPSFGRFSSACARGWQRGS